MTNEKLTHINCLQGVETYRTHKHRLNNILLFCYRSIRFIFKISMYKICGILWIFHNLGFNTQSIQMKSFEGYCIEKLFHWINYGWQIFEVLHGVVYTEHLHYNNNLLYSSTRIPTGYPVYVYYTNSGTNFECVSHG